MEALGTLDYLKLNKWQKFIYKLKCFFFGIPGWFVRKFKAIGLFFKNLGIKFADNFKDIWTTFKNGSWKTRVSFLFMGFGSIMHGQWLRGLVFFLMEALFIFYMVFWGAAWLAKMGTLGTVESYTVEKWDEKLEEFITYTVQGDDSFKILLYSLITIFFIIAFVYTWRLNVKQCRICDEITAEGKKLKSAKDDVKSLLDDQFHKTQLALPVFGITMFTVLPIVFMILVAFTNYSAAVYAPHNLFDWVGLDSFNQLFTFGDSGMSFAFGEILAWTLIWAFFATFTCYFLGMLVAIMINKKGIKIKKVWRTLLVLTIAIPQFISLMYISNMFAENGVVNGFLMDLGWIKTPIKFWGDGTIARIMIIVINIWVGIPYLMLMTTGILMNIPADLYESARIDGANAFQQFTKITLPYMLFVTGPYLLTSFIGNINNFNVIYLLTQGGPMDTSLTVGNTSAGKTDILITWLFNMANGNGDYNIASVIGILIFAVVSVLSLVVFSIMPSNKREDDFS